ncbi:unnamed protein product [marine sediment metagenome]|uniref:Uncharacterized protein n=1 Tax=marine sediment metagenome TaxID=412755 RepID=X0Y5I4_9ZZZZ
MGTTLAGQTVDVTPEPAYARPPWKVRLAWAALSLFGGSVAGIVAAAALWALTH